MSGVSLVHNRAFAILTDCKLVWHKIGGPIMCLTGIKSGFMLFSLMSVIFGSQSSSTPNVPK